MFAQSWRNYSSRYSWSIIAICDWHYDVQRKGLRIRQALEGAIDNAINNDIEGTGDGSFPYVADLRYVYRCGAPSGQRIETLEYYTNGEWLAVEDDDVYTSVSSGYTATGKEVMHRYLIM